MASTYSKGFASRDYFSLEFIPFVTSKNEETQVIEKNSEKSKHLTDNFSGKEACDFYNSIIAIPSTSKTQGINLSTKIKKKCVPATNSNKYDSNKILRYAQEGNLEGVKQCLKFDCQNLINQQDMYGWTPLMCASCDGHYEVVKHLLECGADTNIKNKQGMTAQDIAITKEHINIIDIFKDGNHQALKENPIRQIKKEEFYCNDCKLNYKESSVVHERSIAHLFSARKANPTTFYHIPENNKGFQMMVKSGWDHNKGLGSKAEGRKFPIKTILKKDRSCIGRTKEIPRVTHFNAKDYSAVKRICDPAVKIVREKTLKKWQRHKLERKNRQKEIEFRRQFICDF